MGQTEETIALIKEIESLLGKLGAKDKDSNGAFIHGQGKITVVEDKIPDKLVKKLRWIVTIRNKLIHEAGFQVDDFSHYKEKCNESIKELKAISAPDFSNNKIEQENNKIEEISQDKKNILPGIILLLVVLAIMWWLFFPEMSNEEKENIIIENNKKILTITSTINVKSLELETLKEKQGFLRSMFNDTDQVNELEDKIELLKNNKNDLETISADLKNELNEDKNKI